MATKPSAPLRYAIRWKWWIVFAALWFILGGILWAMDAAARHQAAIEAQKSATFTYLFDFIRHRYISRGLIPKMEDELNGGRPLPRQDVVSALGQCDRITLDGASIARHYAGWKIQVDYGIQLDGMSMRALPPPETSTFLSQFNSAEVWQASDRFRSLLLVLSASVWAISSGPCLLAGPHRRDLGQIAIAAAVLALLAWSADPGRRTFASLPPLNWIFITATGGFLIGLLAALLPIRASQRRSDRCPTCHYDLTGNLSGTCPECGNPTPAELRRRHDEELEPMARALASTHFARHDNEGSEDAEDSEFPMPEARG